MKQGNWHAPARGRRGAGTRGGWTLIELLIVVCVVLLTLLLFSRTMGSAIALTGANRETDLATEGARNMLERLQGVEEFSEVFRLYNDDPGDDPGGPGTGPGPRFTVPGLQPAADDPDGMVGTIRFASTPGVGELELREDTLDEALGMPRDLDLDGAIGGDEKDEYRVLPVEVGLRWKGSSGVQTLVVRTLLAEQ